jgi:hypothetical protein
MAAMKENTKIQLMSVILNNITAIPIVFSLVWFVFKPHLTNFTTEIVRHESYAIKYEFTSEMLTIFRNIPEAQRTTFHRSEIERLEETQKLLRQKLAINYEATLMGD